MRSFGFWISLCSCAAAARMQIVVTGAFLNTGAQAAIEMRRPYLFLVWDRPDWPNPPVSTASLHPLHVHDSAVAIISVHPSKGPGRCGYAATSLSPPPPSSSSLPRPPLSFAVPSAISSSHSSPASRLNKEHAEAGRPGPA